MVLGFLYTLAYYLRVNQLLPIFSISIIMAFYSYIFPYCFLMLCFSVYDFAPKIRRKYYIYLSSLVPILALFLIDPIGQTYANYLLYKKTNYSIFIFIFSVAAAYILFGIILLLGNIIKGKNITKKKDNLKLAIIWIPTASCVLISGYFFPLISPVVICDIQLYISIFLLTALLILLSIYGFYGTKFKIEKYYYENTQKTVNLSTSIINHTIKNELQKLAACSEVIRTNKDPNNLDDTAQIISNSARHLSAMINRIQTQLTEIALIKRNIELNTVINGSLEMLQPFLRNKNIKVIKNFNSETHINGDETHLKEVFINIFNNAMEAMNDGDQLIIDGLKKKKEIIISITDTGKGISSADLPHVFDLFFTTKRKGNYGLGLCYCYNVIKKHGGNIKIQSKENSGTTVTINLPLINTYNIKYLRKRGN